MKHNIVAHLLQNKIKRVQQHQKQKQQQQQHESNVM